MAAYSHAGAQSYGNPAKVVRIKSLERVIREEVVRPAVLPEPVKVSVAPAREVVPPRPTEVALETKPAVTRERRPMVSTGPYLPVTGALPLRYSSSRKWPAPLPKGDASPEELLPQAIAAAPEDEDDASPEEAAGTQEVATNVDPAASSPVRAASVMPEPTILTADMILGYLGNMRPADTRISVRFEPAIPQGTTASTGLSP